jgi:hypothetical protein
MTVSASGGSGGVGHVSDLDFGLGNLPGLTEMGEIWKKIPNSLDFVW